MLTWALRKCASPIMAPEDDFVSRRLLMKISMILCLYSTTGFFCMARSANRNRYEDEFAELCFKTFMALGIMSLLAYFVCLVLLMIINVEARHFQKQLEEEFKFEMLKYPFIKPVCKPNSSSTKDKNV
ncbi:unnamed protein product [Larinioides sclopetarius]|uniref:Uncharacterized protein n=1 Tax=Larinioides sclopetarius TaxID=280406 RepID=A0AAV2B3B7_9ARAC